MSSIHRVTEFTKFFFLKKISFSCFGIWVKILLWRVRKKIWGKKKKQDKN